MRVYVSLFFMGLSYLLMFVGGLAVIALLFAGIYTLFVKSISHGLMMIGGAVVGGWVIQIISSLLVVASTWSATIGYKNEKE